MAWSEGSFRFIVSASERKDFVSQYCVGGWSCIGLRTDARFFYMKILTLLLACCCLTQCCQSESDNKSSDTRYRITLYNQGILDDGTILYSKTYETSNLKYAMRSYVEFDNIKFSGVYLVEKIK